MEVVAKIVIELMMLPVRIIFWMMFATLRALTRVE